MSSQHQVILLRHGESEWNSTDRFAGWVDVPLTERGRLEAVRSGRALRHAGVLPDIVHTSLLQRAVSTAAIALDTADRHWIPARRSWRLNERHYGALQGRTREEVRAEFGDTRFREWRRSYYVAPPSISPDSAFGQLFDPRYRASGIDVPTAESLHHVQKRLVPYWHSGIVPDLRAGHTALVVSHGNALRSLIMYLDRLSADEIGAVDIPTCVPIRYDLDMSMRPLVRGGIVMHPVSA